MKKLYLGSVVGVVVVALVVGGLFVLGFVYAGVKSPKQNVTVSHRVCNSEIIEQYLKINGESPQQDRQSLIDLSKRIKAIDHNEADPTCQTILFFTAFRSEDYQGMRKPMEFVQTMHDKGIYADSDLQSGYSIKMMNSLLKEVVSDTEKS